MPTCHVCGQDNGSPARFCSACGAALTADPPREERKVVTVLFADLVGFTSRAEHLDPEDVRAVLAPYWERLRTELERRGGTVEKFIGDAVMALFGAPVAHDDDPLRAVGAALAIRDWARDEADVQVRIAVNTGEALVLLGARPREGEGMAAGDVVNTTARLQSAAPVNGVLVAETTYRATRDVIDYRECEPVVAKGKAEPIPVWEAVEVRSRLGVDVERATLPLVGRTRELGVIVEAFARAKSEGEPQLVTLVGVPGIGKSRLVGEFFARLEDDPELVWWRQGRALPYGDGISYWALAEMVKAQAGIAENDDARVAEEKLRASVHAVVDVDDERAWVLDALLPLVGGDQRPTSGESAPAWRRYFEGLAEQRPLVMVFEDMHWADDGLLDFIDHLVDWATGVGLLVIATARPELLERRTSWGGGKLNVSTIALTPLSDEESAEIIHTVLEQAVLPAETQRALLERAGGNPLYAEQFARLYLERGSTDDMPLPETVQGLIAARLDGLPAEEKRLIQDASVLGKVFWAGAVEATPESLHALERKGMLRRERRSAVAGESQYAFRHVLVRDAAYAQIPRAARGEKHVRAAEWIERLGRAEDQAELLVHHLLAAQQFGAVVDAGRLREALENAGDRAHALGAFPAAVRYYRDAIALWADAPGDRPLLVAAHARAAFRADGDPAPLGTAIGVLEAAGLPEEAADLAATTANAVWYSGRANAQEMVDRGLALLDGGPSPAYAALLAERGRIALFRGEMASAGADLGLALGLAEQYGLDRLRSTILVSNGVAALTRGDLDAARRMTDAGVELAAPGDPALFRGLANLGVIDWLAGDVDAWRKHHREAVEAATRAGDTLNLRWLKVSTLRDAYERGRWDEALRIGHEALEEGEQYSDHGVLLEIAGILAARGDVEGARSHRDRALERLQGKTDLQARVPSYLGAAWISFVLGDDDLGVELIDAIWPVVESSPNRAPGVNAEVTVAVVRAGRAERWLEFHSRNARITRVRAAELMLSGSVVEAADLWAKLSPVDEAAARVHAARELSSAGRRAEADVQLQRGLAFYRAVGATRIVQQGEASLAAAS